MLEKYENEEDGDVSSGFGNKPAIFKFEMELYSNSVCAIPYTLDEATIY